MLPVTAVLVSSTFAGPAPDKNTTERFEQLEHRFNGRVGIAAIEGGRSGRCEYRAQERFPMCSTFKLLAAAAVLKRVDENREKLDRFVKYGEANLLAYAPVTRAHLQDGGMTLQGLCAAAIKQSDNTAGNLLLDVIGGPAGLTQFARDLRDNLTRLDRIEPELNDVRPGDERDTTTPGAMCNDLQRLLTPGFLSETSRRHLELWLHNSQTGLTLMRAGVPPDWSVGDKTGRSGDGETNDVAVVRSPAGQQIFLAVFARAPSASEEQRDKLVAEAAGQAIQVLNQK